MNNNQNKNVCPNCGCKHAVMDRYNSKEVYLQCINCNKEYTVPNNNPKR